ncbi:MAG: metallophosphoesterase [Candidatus Riflebacteria bacterium]|nr:metallophosphoesterase [Candidatus Riflebacteria bacterium]
MNLFYTIGDVHLGKKFRSKDIPLDKRGVREKLLLARFQLYVNNAIKQVKGGYYKGVVQVGDLFDSFCVSYEDLLLAYQILSEFEKNQIPCYILAGNHDVSKDNTRVSAFSLLKKMMTDSGYKHISFIEENVRAYKIGDETYIFVPYVHGKTYEEQLTPYTKLPGKTVVFGHFEEPYTDWLKRNFGEIYTGHIHLPRKEGNITVVGSIMPLTFAEDSTNQFMRTCTLADYEADLAHGLSSYRCYRIRLKDGEELPNNPNCLQMSIYRDNKDDSDSEDLSVAFETFDFEELMHEALDNLGLFEEIYKVYSEYKMLEASE